MCKGTEIKRNHEMKSLPKRAMMYFESTPSGTPKVNILNTPHLKPSMKWALLCIAVIMGHKITNPQILKSSIKFKVEERWKKNPPYI